MESNILTLVGLALTVFASVWSLAWWLSGKFEALSKYLFARIEQVEKTVLDKLEYHERHDDTRFSSIHNDIWELRIHNAAQDSRHKAKIKRVNEEDKSL